MKYPQTCPSYAQGTKLGRYEIGSKLGDGGMGEVYLAEDTQLHRKLALKVPPAELAENKDRSLAAGGQPYPPSSPSPPISLR